MTKLSQHELDTIRARLERAPPGPWVVVRMLDGYQLLAGVLVEPEGVFRPIDPYRVPYVLASPGGRAFCSQCWDDVRALLLHADAVSRGE